MRHVVPALVGLLSLASPLAGQGTPPALDSNAAGIPRWHVGVAADIGQPVGSFKHNVNNAAGLQAHLLLRLDRHGLAAIRLQGGWLNYGSERQRSCVATTPGCRVAVDVTTANGILSFGVGPQFAFPLGPFRTYGYGLIGISRFATVSGVDGGIVPDVMAGDENFGDSGLAWSGGLGMQLPINQRTNIDFGIAYQGNGRRNYLIKGGVTDQPDGSLAFDVKRSTADFFAIRLGVTRAMRWGRGKSDP